MTYNLLVLAKGTIKKELSEKLNKEKQIAFLTNYRNYHCIAWLIMIVFIKNDNN